MGRGPQRIKRLFPGNTPNGLHSEAGRVRDCVRVSVGRPNPRTSSGAGRRRKRQFSAVMTRQCTYFTESHRTIGNIMRQGIEAHPQYVGLTASRFTIVRAEPLAARMRSQVMSRRSMQRQPNRGGGPVSTTARRIRRLRIPTRHLQPYSLLRHTPLLTTPVRRDEPL